MYIFILRTGTYEIQEMNDLPYGTKIVVYLKTDCREFADAERVKGKYFSIWLNIWVYRHMGEISVYTHRAWQEGPRAQGARYLD